MSDTVLNTAAGLAAVVQVLVRAKLTTAEEFNQLRVAIAAEYDQQQAKARDELQSDPGLKLLADLAGHGCMPGPDAGQ
jgi:hypothetical protein